jgi:hypothetical protein
MDPFNDGAYDNSPFPPEIIYKILEFQFYQLMQNNSSSLSGNVQIFLKSNLTVNMLFYRLVQKIIYRYCIFKTPQTFDVFLDSITKSPGLGEYVSVLDFQEFTSIGLGRTGKMNKEIQMVTSTTILNCLKKTPYLLEFLASENIKDDLDANLLNHLFNNMKYLKAVDFCGCSGENFVSNFQSVRLKKPGFENITDVSLHDCTDLPDWVIERLLVNLPNVRKLDLTHTQVTSKTLSLIPTTAKLTHLSLAYCIQLTTRELIHFFINHPAITSSQLVWLNLQCDSSTNSPLNNNQLTFLLKMFDCDFNYLNLGGLEVTFNNLMLIKKKFLNLKSISIANNNIDIHSIIEFLKPPHKTDENSESSRSLSSLSTLPPPPPPPEDDDESYYQQIEFIDLSKNAYLSRWTIDNPSFLNCCPSLTAFEFSYNIINELDLIGGVFTHRINGEKTTWKAYDSGGRRGWLYKVDAKNPDNSKKIGLIEYDINTGEKIIPILKLPHFLKLANKKVSLSKGVLFDADEIFGDFERGIYKYYGMKM